MAIRSGGLRTMAREATHKAKGRSTPRSGRGALGWSGPLVPPGAEGAPNGRPRLRPWGWPRGVKLTGPPAARTLFAHPKLLEHLLGWIADQ
jgi:hypothetical protein